MIFMESDSSLDIKHCDKCDISIGCKFIPSRGEGQGHSILYILPNVTPSEINKPCSNRKNRIIRNLDDEYNFSSYFTSMVKCPTSIPTPREIKNCFDYIKKEIYVLKPKIIVTVGDVVTKQFIDYNYFKEVVDTPVVAKINNKEVIIYPIYSPYFDNKVNMNIMYDKSFNNLAKIYKAFVNPNYFIL